MMLSDSVAVVYPLSVNAERVARALLSFDPHLRGRCWPRHGTVAARIGCSVRTVLRGLDELRDAGAVLWRRTGRASRFVLDHDRMLALGVAVRRRGSCHIAGVTAGALPYSAEETEKAARAASPPEGPPAGPASDTSAGSRPRAASPPATTAGTQPACRKNAERLEAAGCKPAVARALARAAPTPIVTYAIERLLAAGESVRNATGWLVSAIRGSWYEVDGKAPRDGPDPILERSRAAARAQRDYDELAALPVAWWAMMRRGEWPELGARVDRIAADQVAATAAKVRRAIAGAVEHELAGRAAELERLLGLFPAYTHPKTEPKR